MPQIVPLGQTYSYADIVKASIELAKRYPDIIKLYEIGKSHDNRSILMIDLGNGNEEIIITGGVHGRETINPVVLLRLIEDLAILYEKQENLLVEFKTEGGLPKPIYTTFEDFQKNETQFNAFNLFLSFTGSDFIVRDILNQYTFHIVPLLNPDGYEIALQGFEAIKDLELRRNAITTGIPHEEWKYNARGVDINRNFPSKTYVAKRLSDHPASELETKALIELFHTIPSIGFLDIHSRGKEIYYYRKEMPEEYNQKQEYLAQRLSNVTGYDLVPKDAEIGVGDSGGNTVHYYSEIFHKPAITIETVDDEATFPLDVSYQYETFNDLLLVPFEFARGISTL